MAKRSNAGRFRPNRKQRNQVHKATFTHKGHWRGLPDNAHFSTLASARPKKIKRWRRNHKRNILIVLFGVFALVLLAAVPFYQLIWGG